MDGNPSAHPVPANEVLYLDFEGSYTAPGAVVATAQNVGARGMEATVTTSDGGRITRARGFDSSSALKFPAYSAKSTPAAVLLVRDTSGADRLSPGDRSFVFGADVNLDAESSGSATDNGDNLMQRGLFEDSAQYKLQLDHGTPSCRVSGTTGVGLVKARTAVRPRTWYRISCRRIADTLILIVRRLGQSGPAAEETVTQTAATGTVRMPVEYPLSVGGKVSETGEITTSATDQLNGLVDNVRYELLD